MVMERVAAAPIDQLNIGVDPGLPIVSVRLARMQEHIRKSCHGDVIVDRIYALWQRGPWDQTGRSADMG